MTHRITTTMQPGRVVEVSDTELVDLTRMGVVASEVLYTLDDQPAPTPLVSSMQAGVDSQEVEDGKEQEADGGGSPQAAVQ
jgi:hypothetical protein